MLEYMQLYLTTAAASKALGMHPLCITAVVKLEEGLRAVLLQQQEVMLITA